MLLFCLSIYVAVVIVIVYGKAIENVIHEKKSFVLCTKWIENYKLVINGSAVYYQINTKNGLNYLN